MITHTLIVFPDGETWSTADGSRLIVVDNETFFKIIKDQINAGDAPTLASISLSDFTPEIRDGNATA